MTPRTNSREEQTRHDARLLERIALQDQAALAELYDFRGSLVYSLVLKMVGRSADAEEVTQETFLKIWHNAGRYDINKGAPITWIVTIARRLAIDRTRSKGYRFDQRSAALDETSGEMDKLATMVDPTDQILSHLEAGEVRHHLGQLSEHQLKVIHLSYYEGYSHSEIAKRLELPLGTVKSRLREGIGQLRKLMDRQEPTT